MRSAPARRGAGPRGDGGEGRRRSRRPNASTTAGSSSAAFFLLNLAGQASGTLNFGLFVIPISEELGLSRQTIGWAQTGRLWAGGLSGVAIGWWLDRYGPRVPVLVAIVVATVGLLVLARAQSAAVLFGVLLALGASGWTAAGGGALFATVPVAKWFIRLRGRATGMVQLGLGVGGAVFLPLTQVLISNHGWRSAWVTLAWLSAAMLPLVLLLRRQPSDLGLEPDGGPGGASRRRRRSPARSAAEAATASPAPAPSAAAPSVPAPPAPAPPAPAHAWTLRAAARTATMWQLSGAFAILGCLLGAASVHRVPHWVELGFSPGTVSFAFGVDAATATITALAAGFLVERLQPRIVGAASCGLFCAALLLMVLGRAWPPLLFSSTVLFGAGVGLNMVVQGVIWAQYYGWRFVGTIRGVVLPLIVLAGGLSRTAGRRPARCRRQATASPGWSRWCCASWPAVLIFSALPPRLPAAPRRR